MKISKFFLGLTVILFAAIGAFASAQKSVLFTNVYYLNGAVCTEVLVNTTCAIAEVEGCEELLFDLDESPLFITAQIYATKTAGGACIDPYDRP